MFNIDDNSGFESHHVTNTNNHTGLHTNTCYRLPGCEAVKKPGTQVFKLGVSHYAVSTTRQRVIPFDQTRTCIACKASLIDTFGNSFRKLLYLQ